MKWYVIFAGETKFSFNGTSRKSWQKVTFDPGLERKVDVQWGDVQGISGGRTTEATHQSIEEYDVFGE